MNFILSSFVETDPTAASTSTDAIASLEKTTTAEHNLNNVVRPRISQLSDLSERRNADPYSLSKTLRHALREDKKADKRVKQEEESFKDKFSLSSDLKLVKEDEVREEAKEEWGKARIEYGREKDAEKKMFESKHGSLGLSRPSSSRSSSSRPLPSRSSSSSAKLTPRSNSGSSAAKASLMSSLLRNTQRKADPFGAGIYSSSSAPRDKSKFGRAGSSELGISRAS